MCIRDRVTTGSDWTKPVSPARHFQPKIRHFQFTRLNMGYVNSGSFFTQSLYKIFAAEVRKHMIIYVDDVFIMHRDIDEHLEFLNKIFNKFREYNLRLHPKKMTIATTSANFWVSHCKPAVTQLTSPDAR